MGETEGRGSEFTLPLRRGAIPGPAGPESGPKPYTALRDAIHGSGLTPYAFGKAAGVATAQLDRFVSGERSLSLASAAKVAAALGLVLVPRR